MPLLELAEAPSASQSNGLNTSASTFGSGAERYDGNVFSLDEGTVQEMRDRSFEESVHRKDSNVYSMEDLTKVHPDPIMQRQAPLVSNQAFLTDPKTVGFWGKKLRLTSLNKTGVAKPITRSDDFPLVEFNGRQYETGFVTLGVSWTMNWTDYKEGAVAGLNFNEQSEKQSLCRQALREAIERLAFMGDTSRQILGIANNPYIPRYASPIQFTQDQDPGRIQQEIAKATSLSYVKTKGAAGRHNTMLGSLERLDTLRKQEYSTTRETNRRTLAAALVGTGIQPGSVIDAPYMDNVGVTNSHAFFFYNRGPAYITRHVPVFIEFLPIYKPHGAWDVTQYAIARVGSVWPKYPEDCLLMTDI